MSSHTGILIHVTISKIRVPFAISSICFPSTHPDALPSQTQRGERKAVAVLGKHCPHCARAFGNSQCSQQWGGNMVQCTLFGISFWLHSKCTSWYLRRKEPEKCIRWYLCQLLSFVKGFRRIIFVTSRQSQGIGPGYSALQNSSGLCCLLFRSKKWKAFSWLLGHVYTMTAASPLVRWWSAVSARRDAGFSVPHGSSSKEKARPVASRENVTLSDECDMC